MSTVIVTTREDLEAIMASLIPQHMVMPPEVVALEQLKRKEYLTTDEVAMLYPLNVHSLRKHRVNGEGPAYIKVGDKVIYSQKAIQQYLESRRIKTIDQP